MSSWGQYWHLKVFVEGLAEVAASLLLLAALTHCTTGLAPEVDFLNTPRAAVGRQLR